MSWRYVIPYPLLSLMIFVLWMILTNAASLASPIAGIILALGVPQFTRRFWPNPPHLKRTGVVLRLFVAVLGDIVVANLRVARLVVGPIERLRPAFIEVPLDLRDPFVAAVLGSIVSLTPGTISIDVDRKRWVLQVHALDASDPAALIAEIKRRYELPLKEIFSC